MQNSVRAASLTLCLPSQDSASAASHPQGSHSALSAPESALRALGLASSAGQHPANSLAGPAQTETNSSSLAEVGGRAVSLLQAYSSMTHLSAGSTCQCVRSAYWQKLCPVLTSSVCRWQVPARPGAEPARPQARASRSAGRTRGLVRTSRPPSPASARPASGLLMGKVLPPCSGIKALKL